MGGNTPGGNEFAADRLNSGEGAQTVGAPTPVGIYPKGVSSYGVWDCAGNVDEFCATRWGKEYPYNVQVEEWCSDYLEGESFRVLRGGGFFSDSRGVRCAYRLRLDPRFDVVNNIGFRVVVSPS